MQEEREERRLFSYEERKAVLKKTGGICAFCGKKLTTKTMTVDHIIPISRGGTNDLDNLTPLCEEHNKQKRNLLFMPITYYIALIGTGYVQSINNHFIDWWREHMRENHDIEMYPLIAPEHYSMIRNSLKYSRLTYVKGLTIRWTLIGCESYAEVEAVTGLNFKTIRYLLRREIPNEDPDIPYDYIRKPIALYCLRKYSNDKICAVVAIRYDKDRHDAVIYCPWCDMSTNGIQQVLTNFMSLFLSCVEFAAQYPVNDIMLLSDYEISLYPFWDTSYANQKVSCPGACYRSNRFKMTEQSNDHTVYGMTLLRTKDLDVRTKSDTDYITIPDWLTPPDYS